MSIRKLLLASGCLALGSVILVPSCDAVENSSRVLSDADIGASAGSEALAQDDGEVFTGVPEHVSAPAPSLRVDWVDLGDRGHAALDATATSVRITHAFKEAVRVELSLRGDAGTTRSTFVELDRLTLEPGEAGTVALDLAPLLDRGPQLYSGLAHVTARAYRADDHAELDKAVSASLYFHPRGQRLEVYDQRTLHATYRSGDFDALLADEAFDDEEGFTDRVVAYARPSTPGDEDPYFADRSTFAEPRARADSSELTTAPQPTSAMYTVCIRIQVDTVDSGYTNSKGLKEDIWNTANNSPTYAAYGVRVRIGSKTLDANNSGCVSFTGTSIQPVRVYAYSSDNSGNFIRARTGSDTDTSSYPGQTYSWYVSSVSLGSGPNYVDVGGYTARWTGMNAFARSLRRYNDVVSNVGYHVVDSTNCGLAENYDTDPINNYSHISIPDADSCNNGRSWREKFLLAHEYGHAYLYQYSGTFPQVPASVSAPDGVYCQGDVPVLGLAYANSTIEHSSLAHREGFAHFVSARVWNNHQGDGQFRWDGTSYDLERWNPSSTAGGYLVNFCCRPTDLDFQDCVADLDGRGNIMDWLRALWDQHTAPSGCSMNRTDMAFMHFLTIISSGLTNENFFDAAQSAANVWGSGCASKWAAYGCHNGIDRDGSMWSGC